MSRIWKGLGKTAIAMATLFTAQQAVAQVNTSAGTLADTTVSNTVSVDYAIGGVGQAQVQSTVTFKVDRKINIIVAEVGTADTEVVPSASDRVTAFTVTNASNVNIDVALSTLLDLTTGPRGNTANFTATNVRIYLDNGDGNFTVADGAAITHFDNLERTADGNPTAGIRTFFVVADIPAGLNNNDVEVVTLTAGARQMDGTGAVGAVFTDDAGIADDKDTVQTVFADADGPATDDANRDGKHSDDDAYKVVLTALTVAKSVATINHTIGGDTIVVNPKAIPGAVLEYCLLMTNSGAVPATAVTLSDAVPAQVTYEAGTMVSGTTCVAAATAEDDDNAGADDTDGFSARYISGTTTVSGVVDTIPAGETRALKFRVKVK